MPSIESSLATSDWRRRGKLFCNKHVTSQATYNTDITILRPLDPFPIPLQLSTHFVHTNVGNDNHVKDFTSDRFGGKCVHVGPYVDQLCDPLLHQVVVPPSMTINRKNALRCSDSR
jgi:hypothetical protein